MHNHCTYQSERWCICNILSVCMQVLLISLFKRSCEHEDLKKWSVCHRMTGRLDAAPVSFLWDHLVAGRSILPGAGMMEFSAASGRALANSYLQTSTMEIGLANATIPAAVILTQTPKTGPTLESTVDLKAGTLEVGNYPIGKPQGKFTWKLIRHISQC